MTRLTSNSSTINKAFKSLGRSRNYPRSPSKIRKSPVKSHVSPSKSSFTIFEDDLKENIPPVKSDNGGPSPGASSTKSGRRAPLAPISITAAPGYITIESERIRLQEEWIPSVPRGLSVNESMAIFRDLPSYLTPPRRVLNSIFQSSSSDCESSILSKWKHFDIYEDEPESSSSHQRIVFTIDDNKENIPPKVMV